MEKSNSGMHGHGMPIETKQIQHKEIKPNGTEINSKENVTTTIHESKHFPFQIIEIISSDTETKFSEHVFKIGVGGAFMSNKEFSTMENANKYIGGRPWELITNLICFTIQNAIEYERNAKK